MGNDHSSVAVSTTQPSALMAVGRRSIDAGLARKVRSSHGTPRLSCSSDPPHADQKHSDSLIDFTSRPAAMHRLSADERDIRRYGKRNSQPKLLSDRESPSRFRRASQAADMFSETGDFGITLAEQLQLSSYQIQCLQQTWSRLRTSPNFLCNVFRATVASNTMAKELFQKASIIEGFSSGGKCWNIKEHSKSLTELIDFCIHEIHSSTKVAHDRCSTMGEVHCSAADKSMSQVWDQFGDCLAEAITKADPIRGKRECLKAWNALISFIVDSSKGGYLAEYKRRTSKKWSRQENFPSST